MKYTLRFSLGMLLAGAMSAWANAAITFTLLTPAPTGSQVLVPAAAVNAANAALDYIKSTLDVAAGVPTQDITVQLTHAPLMGSLGASSPQYCAGASFDAIGYNQIMVPNHKALTGVDCNAGAADVVIEMASDLTLPNDYGSFPAPPNVNSAAEYDYYGTIIHEVIHSMGFANVIQPDGAGALVIPAGQPNTYSKWDSYVGDKTGTLIDGTFAIDTTRWNAAKQEGIGSQPVTAASKGLYFYGPMAMMANGNQPVPLYSEDGVPYSPGSHGGGHMDTQFYGDHGRLMNHASSPGVDQRTLNAVELGMMKDIGYTVVPEPSAFLLIGLIASGLGFKKRQSILAMVKR